MIRRCLVGILIFATSITSYAGTDRYSPWALEDVKRLAVETAARAQIPVVVFDLDDTLIDVRERNIRVIQAFLQQSEIQRLYPSEVIKLRNLKEHQIRYLLTDTMADLEVTNPKFISALKAFWDQHFFSNFYCAQDKPNPGAVSYVQKLSQLGVTVVYLTGRDAPRMEAGTRQNLHDLGFPIGTSRALLIMKRSAKEEDLPFKRSVFQRLEKLGTVIGMFENEPASINAFHEAFPEGRAVFVDTVHSPTTATPAPTIAWIKDFMTSEECPNADARETEQDCPWAGMGRDIALKTTRAGIVDVLKGYPSFFQSLTGDAGHPWLEFWGTSLNFDEIAQTEIVPARLLTILEELTKASSRKSPTSKQTGHAGILHTYGYLFSNLLTPFGYKRARWVDSSLDEGFGLPRDTINPVPQSGTLFLNVTFLAGSIAFRSDPTRLIQLHNGRALASEALKNFKTDDLEIISILETVELNRSRRVNLKTDLVAFPHKLKSKPYSHLLVYSVDDSESPGTRLITAFPVEPGFIKSAIDPTRMGPGQVISTRYNAFVPGLTGTKVTGVRTRLE